MEQLRCWKRVFFEVCLNNPSPLAARPPQILFTLLISLANIFFIKQDRIPNQYYIQIKEVLNHLNTCPPDPGLSLEGELFVGAHPRAPQSALGLSCRLGGGCPLMPPHPLPCRELQQGRGRGGGVVGGVFLDGAAAVFEEERYSAALI